MSCCFVCCWVSFCFFFFFGREKRGAQRQNEKTRKKNSKKKKTHTKKLHSLSASLPFQTIGAHAVCPYLAFETARQWRVSPRTVALVKAGKAPDVSVAKAQANYKKAVEKGLLKILSKMGISLLSCYHGAQIFEAYGLGPDVVDAAFKGSVSRVGGMTLADLSREAAAFWAKGFPAADGAPPPTKLEDYGFIQSRPKGEHHVNNQAMAKLLHKAIG